MRLRSFAVLLVSLIVLFGSMPAEDNVSSSSSYMKMDRDSFQDRHQRLITFNTDENSDIAMELSFTVPFITIPVKKTMEATKGALANVNFGAILISGVILLAISVAAPFVSYLVSKKGSKNDDRRNRNEDSAIWVDILKHIDRVLAKNNLNSESCLQRIFCWMIKNASTKVAKGSATSAEKIMDGIATSEWFRRMIDDTILESAVRNGLSKSSCSKRYNKCKINQRNVGLVLKELVKEFFEKKKY